MRIEVDGEQDLDWANHFLLLAGVDAEALLGGRRRHGPPGRRTRQPPLHASAWRRPTAALLAENGRLARERLGLGAAGGASAALRKEDALEQAREEIRQCRHRIGTLEAELAAAADRASAAEAERDEYRRAFVAVRSSRLTNLAARLAGHRFERP